MEGHGLMSVKERERKGAFERIRAGEATRRERSIDFGKENPYDTWVVHKNPAPSGIAVRYALAS